MNISYAFFGCQVEERSVESLSEPSGQHGKRPQSPTGGATNDAAAKKDN